MPSPTRDEEPTNLFALWTPRSTHIRTHKGQGGLYFLPSRSKFPFSPQILSDYHAPPRPPSLKKPPPVRAAPPTVDELSSTAAEMRKEIEALEKSGVRSAPPVPIQLGLMLVNKDDMIKKLLKDWDTKGKGEIIKADFRLNLRNTGINATSAEADALFDSWDDDGGGSLDLGELKQALLVQQKAAKQWNDQPDPNREKIQELKHKAQQAEEAAKATQAADEAERELAELRRSNDTRADVQLGALLYRRKIKPGAVVTSWARSKGEHAGELSRAEFRDACISLGLKNMEGAKIDEVFAMFDEDGGGYLDAGEAAVMIKKLQLTAETAEHDRWVKEREAASKRSAATKLAHVATAPPAPPEETEQQQQQHGADGHAAPGSPSLKHGAEHGSPSSTQQKKRPSTKKKPGLGDKPALAVESVIKVVSDLFSTDRKDGAGRSSREDRLEHNRAAKQIAKRMQSLDVVHAWNSWAESAKARAHNSRLLKRTLGALANVQLKSGLNTWAVYAEEHKAAVAIMRRSMHHMTMAFEILAFNHWSEEIEERRRLRSMMLRAKENHVRLLLRCWREQYGKPPCNPCRALAKCLGGGGKR